MAPLEPLAREHLAHLVAAGRMGLLEPTATAAFDRYTRLAAQIFDVPMAMVKIIDHRHELITSSVGLPAWCPTGQGMPLSQSLCEHVVATRSALAIDDTRSHALATRLPAVQALGVGAYAGAPLTRGDGPAMGALCVMDVMPRRWAPRDVEILRELAAFVMTEVEKAALAAEAGRAEARMEQLLAASPTVLYAVRVERGEARTTWVTHNVERVTGCTVAEALAPDWWSTRVHPDDAAIAFARSAGLRDARRQSVHEYRFRHADGSYRWVRDEVRVGSETEGGALEVVGAWVDVTAQKTAERELRESEARNAANIAAALDCIVTMDHTGRIVEFNPAAERTFGHPREQAIGRELADLLLPAWARSAHRRGMARYIETGEARVLSRRIEVMALRADGAEFPAELAITRIPLDGPPMFTAFLRDVTEQKRAAAALARSEAQLSHAQRVARVGSWELEVATGALFWSDELCRLYGMEPGAVAPGRAAFLDRLHPDDRERTGRLIADAQAAGVPYQFDYRLLWPDGSLREHDARGEPVRDAAGVLVRWIGTAQDVTEARRLAAHYRQAQKMEAVGRLAAGVAHDFNNLLSAISGYAEFLAADIDPASPLRSDVHEIQKATVRAAGLTRQLLAYSRQQVLQPRLVDVPALVAEMQAMLQRLVGEDVQLAALSSTRVGQVKADRGQLEQVLMNLVVNARDAMPAGGTITVETSDVVLDETAAVCWPAVVQPGPYVLVAVSDTGCGMDAATQARIFEPFFTTKGPGEGTGLGLATVYGIVKQSGGYIWVHSELGRGTTFKVYLPRVAAAEAGLLTSTAEHAMPAGAPERATGTVLLVEDEEAVRAIAVRALQHAGYTVLEARHGRDALELFVQRDTPLDLVITDVVMPEMSGGELARQLALVRPTTPVLFVSGYPNGHLLDGGALPAGAALLDKPFTPQRLVARVREMLAAAAATPERVN